MADLKAYAEAYKRGLLKGPKLSAYQELTRRGLAGVPSLPPTAGTLDASPRPTPEHMGKAAFDYLKGNLVGDQTDYKWHERTAADVGKERLYSEPVRPEDFELGEVDAYHGGPAAFRNFSNKFMKTGEGAHAFGWGTYASEAKGVAKSYAKPRTEMAYQGIRYSAMPKDEFRSMVSLIADKIRRGQSPFVAKTQARADIERSLRAIDEGKPISTAVKGKLLERLDAVKRVDENLISSIDTGSNLYKVKLNPGRKDEVWLDWDKPVPDKMVDKIARKLVDDRVKKQGLREKYSDVVDLDKKIEKQVDLYKKEFGSVGRVTYDNLTRLLGSKEAASKFLNRAGIDGIRYPVGSLSGATPKPKFMVGDTKVPKDVMQTLSEWSDDYSDPLEFLMTQSKSDVIKDLEAYKTGFERFAWEGVTPDPYRQKIDSGLRDAIDFLKNTKGEFKEITPKNYVIFDPKKIKIMEGPGQNAAFNVGFGQRVKPGKFRQLSKGAKPVKR